MWQQFSDDLYALWTRTMLPPLTNNCGCRKSKIRNAEERIEELKALMVARGEDINMALLIERQQEWAGNLQKNLTQYFTLFETCKVAIES